MCPRWTQNSEPGTLRRNPSREGGAMSDEAGFLKAIADQPAERSTRLVYADWLDEHDRPREAEFLRLQLQVAELSTKLLDLGGGFEAKWLTAVGQVSVNSAEIKL